MSVREYIINNFKNDEIADIRKAIEISITSKEEDPLIGMGVLFELLWNSSDEATKTIILENIKKAL